MERFAVIGLGRFGFRLATLLSEAGAEVIAADRRRDIIEQVRDKVALAVCLDCTDENALKAQGIHNVDVAVVASGSRARLLRNVAPRRGAWLGFRVLDARGADAVGGV